MTADSVIVAPVARPVIGKPFDRLRADFSVGQPLCDPDQTTFHLTPDQPHLFQRRQRAACVKAAVLLCFDRNKHASEIRLHGREHRAVLQQNAVHPQPFKPLRLNFLAGRVPFCLYNAVARGHVEHAGRHGAVRLADGKEIDQHLHIQSITDVGKAERFRARFIIDDTHIFFPVLFEHVDAVDNPFDDYTRPIRRAQVERLHRRVKSNGKLKRRRFKRALAKLKRQPLDQTLNRTDQAAEQVFKARGHLVVIGDARL